MLPVRSRRSPQASFHTPWRSANPGETSKFASPLTLPNRRPDSLCLLCLALECALPRAFWKGFLKLSLVSCPVVLFPATTVAERLSFRQVNRGTGHRLKHKLVDSITGETIDTLDKARGYEVGENQFLLVEDRELEQARSERSPPGALQLAEPPRSAPGPSPVRAAEPDEDDDEEEQGREEGAFLPKASIEFPRRALLTSNGSRQSLS